MAATELDEDSWLYGDSCELYEYRKLIFNITYLCLDVENAKMNNNGDSKVQETTRWALIRYTIHTDHNDLISGLVLRCLMTWMMC